MRTFPGHEGSGHRRQYNFEKAKTIPVFKPRAPEADGTRRMFQEDVDRVREFHKCIECFLCQDMYRVIGHEAQQTSFAGPRFFVRLAALEMHPLDTNDRLELIKARARPRPVQHHQVLHRRLPGVAQDHRQRDHPTQRASRDELLRPAGLGTA